MKSVKLNFAIISKLNQNIPFYAFAEALPYGIETILLLK